MAGTLMRSHDWALSPLGLPADWPQALKTVTSLLLRSKTPVFVAWGPELCLLYNDACQKILGKTHSANLGQPLQEAWPDVRPGVDPLVSQAGDGGCVGLDSASFVLRCNGVGEPVWFSFSTAPVDAPDGTVAGLYCTLSQTGAKLAEEKSRQSQTQWHYSRDEQAPGVLRVVREPGFVHELAPGLHQRLVGRDDGVGQMYLALWRNVDGQGGGVTDQTRHAAELRETINKYQTMANAIPLIVWSTQPDGRHDYYNQQWYDYTGVARGSSHGQGWKKLFHPDDLQVAMKNWRHSLATGAPYEVQYRLRHQSGDYRWVLTRARPVHDAQGAIARWLGTCTDIHEQKAAQESLQQANRLKDEFLAMLAHELRNPLAPIASAADLLSRRALDAAGVLQLSEVISRQARHMTHLLDDLLDVSRVTRGLVTLEKKPVDLASIITDAVEQVGPLLESRAHRLVLQLDPRPAQVSGDRMRLVQVLGNVLNNAIKYTPNGGSIALQTVVNDGQLKICVRDNGVGMSGDLLKVAFELFTQGERTSDRTQGGLGIGLALVRSLVGLHGGTVSVRSPGVGQGSELTIMLPCVAQVGVPIGPVAHEGGATPDGQSLRILVVDDNIDAAQLLGMFVELLGHQVFVQFHPADALECARQVLPHICLLDIGLPDMDGYTLARQLRQLPGMQDTVMAAVTGYSQRKDKQAAFAAGFNAHFAKPVDARQLEFWLAGVMAQMPGHATAASGAT